MARMIVHCGEPAILNAFLAGVEWANDDVDPICERGNNHVVLNCNHGNEDTSWILTDDGSLLNCEE